VEDYIWEFEKPKIRVRLNEDNELTIIWFIKGLSPNIVDRVKLQPYLSFDDVFHMAIKVEKQLRGDC